MCVRLTCAIARYSITTQDALSPKTVQIATLVEKLSTKEMNTGAKSLQKRSMRRIEAFKSEFSLANEQ